MAQGLQNDRRVVLHATHPILGEELRQDAAFDDPVLYHVRDPGGRAQVVLQHQISTVHVADQIDPGNVRVNVVGRIDIPYLAPEVLTLVDELKEAGQYSVNWNGLDENGRRVSSGVYFYRMSAGDFTAVRKMVILK